MRKLLLTLIIGCLALFSSQIFSQSNNLSVFDRHNGIIMQRALALEFDESTKLFYYNKDDHNEQKHLEVRNFDLYNIKGTDNCKYILSIKFYNPLRVKFNFEETNIEDPAIIAINNFIDKIPAELYNLNKTFETKNQVETNEKNTTFSFQMDTTSFLLTKGNSAEEKVSSSIILSQWIYELKTQRYLNSTSVDSKFSINDLISEINKIEAADNYLYNEIEATDIDKNKIRKNLSDWVSSIQNEIYGQISLPDFKKKLEYATSILKKLETAKAESDNSLTNIFSLMTDKFSDKIGLLIYNKDVKGNDSLGNAARENFRDYSKAARQWISLTIAERKRYNDEAVKKTE